MRRLYDPRVPELVALLDSETFFPTKDFAMPAVLDRLVSLGLQRELSLSSLVDSARSVEMNCKANEAEAARRGHALLAHLDERQMAKDERMAFLASFGADSRTSVQQPMPTLGQSSVVNKGFDGDSLSREEAVFWEELKDIQWCPVLVEAPQAQLPWGPIKQSRICAPRHVRPREDLWLVSGSMRILDGQLHSSLADLLGWTQRLPAKCLATQLVQLSQMYGQRAEAIASRNVSPVPQPQLAEVPEQHAVEAVDGIQVPQEIDGAKRMTLVNGTNGIMKEEERGSKVPPQQGQEASVTPPSEELLMLNKKLSEEIPRIYANLETYVSSNDDLKIVRVLLQGFPWVWVGERFVAPHQLAFDSPAHFHPYLHVVPSEIATHRSLLLALGVQEQFKARDYARVLHNMAADAGGGALGLDQLSFAIRVVEALAEAAQATGLDALGTVPLLPDSRGVLVPAVDLVFNDAAWLAGGAQGKLHHA